MTNKYYEQIDETVFEETLENGLKVVVIPKKVFIKLLLHIQLNLVR